MSARAGTGIGATGLLDQLTRDPLPGEPWRPFLMIGMITVAAYPALPSQPFRDVTYVLVGLVCVAAILLGIRRHRPADPRPWVLMAIGQLLWVAGDICYTWLSPYVGSASPSVADVLYLASYPVTVAGLHMLIRVRCPRRDAAGLLDSATVTTGLGMLSWVLLARPTMTQADGSSLEAIVAVAYPLADILLVGGVIRLLNSPGGITPALRMLLTATGLLVIADSASAALSLSGDAAGVELDLLWLASYVVWGTAALHPSMIRLTEHTGETELGFRRLRLTALTIAVLIAPGVLAVQTAFRVTPDHWAVVLGSVLTFLLVVTRMNVAIDQIATVNRQREQLQEELAFRATHDPLTSLPNRAEAMRLIDLALAAAANTGRPTALLFLDLDGFKAVNDTHGHLAGDQVLRIVASRIWAEIRDGNDAVARLGGDEFLILLAHVDDPGTAPTIARRLISTVSRPIRLDDGTTLHVGASIGVAHSHGDITDAKTLLHHADLAVYRAKTAGRGRVDQWEAAA